MEEDTDGSSVEDDKNHVLSVGSTSRDLQTAYLIISLVLSVGCGLLLIFLVWKKEYLQKPSHYLRCNLAVDDIVFTGCLIPVRVYALFRQDASGGQTWCSTEALVAPASVLSMYGTYIMMAVDLYYFVCHPLHYHDKVTTKRVVLGILAFRAFSLFGGLAPVAVGGLPEYNQRCEFEPANSTTLSAIFRSVNIVFMLLVVLSVLVIYSRIFKEARRQQERDENRDLWVFQTKAFKVMVPHATVLTVCMTTAGFRIATHRGLISEEQMSQHALIVTERVAFLLFLTLSSVANPIIYSFRLPEFRRACRELCGWPTNANPPVAVPTRRHRQDDTEMAVFTGPGLRGGPASELAPAQTSPEGLIMHSTAGDMPSNQAQKQTTPTDTIPGPVSGHAESTPLPGREDATIPGPATRAGFRGRETVSGPSVRLTVRAEVHAEPRPRPGQEDATVNLPGQVYTDAEEEDVPTLTLDTEIDEATAGHTLDRPPSYRTLAGE
ncbi:PREDICTED: olfactory receptor 5AK2-like [Branchiostoma belcheri]|uniref:Olfactory receptor 5AK2-like n=1 Tax=Branchiostoma belcheri TaxID=7741 RepID=A0A6P4YET0_BRABE|nr:PREDICTED: olfactory receptor 5AK2-like [Branchiostoma belcheri]